jgi:hypothetical protein
MPWRLWADTAAGGDIKELLAMWLHLPEISVNLAQCLRVIPQPDGKIQIVQPDNITVTVDGVNAAAVCGLLATLPGGHLDSWLGKRINLNRPGQPAPAAGAPAAE